MERSYTATVHIEQGTNRGMGTTFDPRGIPEPPNFQEAAQILQRIDADGGP
jgi:hypothetical protein